jgi:hypothetical protein
VDAFAAVSDRKVFRDISDWNQGFSGDVDHGADLMLLLAVSHEQRNG